MPDTSTPTAAATTATPTPVRDSGTMPDASPTVTTATAPAGVADAGAAPPLATTKAMAVSPSARAGFPRADFVREGTMNEDFGVVEKPITVWERIYQQGAVRKTVILILLAVIWQLYAMKVDNALIFPTFASTVEALYQGVVHGNLAAATSRSCCSRWASCWPRC